jgi:hypothetical protein
MSAQCLVAGVGVFCSGYPSAQAFLAGEPAGSEIAPSGELLDKHSRRRASELTKACADVYQQALAQSGFDALQVGAVFGSALGEAGTTIGLLEQLWRGPGMLSPMRFAASVHNTAAGVVSIGTKNTGFTTALGADHDTPAMALLEGMAFALAQQAPVIVVCADEAAPRDLVSGEEGWDLVSCAVALAPVGFVSGSRAPRITTPAPGRARSGSTDLPRRLAQNPVAGLLDLIAALADDAVASVRLDRGRGHGYCVAIERAQ